MSNNSHLNLDELSEDIKGRRFKWYELFEPPQRLSLSEWSDKFRILSPKTSSESGLWRTSRAEYQREIMDCISDKTLEEVVLMSSSQVGKTEIILNAIGYKVDHAPCPLIVMMPTLKLCEAFSKDRLAEMIRLSPVLKNKVKDPRSRDSDNTLLHKGFIGGSVTLVASNSPSDVSSRPAQELYVDEADRCGNAGNEGDSINLLKARTQTFLNRKHVYASTPTIKGLSRIEQLFESSDQRYYFVPCPECGHFQRLLWSRVRWDEDKPETSKYQCEKCEALWNDAKRWKAINQGHWRKTNPKSKIAGFHLSALYSPWSQLEKMVDQFLNARELPDQLKTFVNTVLGETYEDEGEGVEVLGLYQRREKYEDECPQGVDVVVAGIDVQDDRLEITFLGISERQEIWVLDHRIILEDPSTPHAWDLLTENLRTEWSQGEYIQKVRVAAIDTGGHFTQTVYQYIRSQKGVYGVKGVGGFGKPIIGRPSRNNQLKIRLFPIGVDTAKELIYSRLRQDVVGAGYIHFPEHLDKEYFKQLTAERIQKRLNKGFLKREFVKVYPRNEALDTFVYAYSSFLMISPNMLRKPKRRKNPEVEIVPRHIENLGEDPPVEEPRKEKRRKRIKFQKSRLF